MTMPKKKKTQTTSVSFHRGFTPPTAEGRRAALGAFPGAPNADGSRRDMLLRLAPVDGDDDERDDPPEESYSKARRPGANLRHQCPHRPSLERSHVTAEDALSDLNSRELYVPTARSVTSLAVPRPRDEMDWLAQVPEEGQTFDEYVRFQTSRSGRIRPMAHADGEDIVLLPIVRAGGGGWTERGGPPLDKLVGYTKAFFDRNVRVLPPATVGVAGIEFESSECESDSSGGRKKRQRRMDLARPGAFASSGSRKGMFQIRFPQADGSMTAPTNIVGRADARSKHVQLKVDSVLDKLASFRESQRQLGAMSGPRDFCIMGITMEDLYDGPKDLFCAGMAFGGSKVALFSFFRYHPNLKMHPLHWYNFGYSVKPGSYSYYDDDDQNPTGLTRDPPPFDETNGEEFLRRSSKLLTHELGHLYGLDHCVHNRCLMMGTGHLVEDFRAPCHLCGVCLRKLQWRLGFDVRGRYGVVADAFRDMGMTREQKWSERQLNALSVLRSHPRC